MAGQNGTNRRQPKKSAEQFLILRKSCPTGRGIRKGEDTKGSKKKGKKKGLNLKTPTRASLKEKKKRQEDSQ